MFFELIEILVGKCGKNVDIKCIFDKEGEQMLVVVGKNCIVIFDISGKFWDMLQLVVELECWKLDGCDVSLLIGGFEGLLFVCKVVVEQSWLLLVFIFFYLLVCVLVVESLYWVWSIIINYFYYCE